MELEAIQFSFCLKLGLMPILEHFGLLRFIVFHSLCHLKNRNNNGLVPKCPS